MPLTTVSIVVALAGGVVYMVTGNAKAGELARIAYFVGLLWLIYAVGGHALRL